jgi:hypothetical protein
LALVRQRSCVKEHTNFSGSIPAAYDRYLGPILFQPYAEDLAAPILILPQGTKLPVTESLRSWPAGWRQSLAFSKGYGF